jgi:dolichol-phosphate mannosyltransferase
VAKANPGVSVKVDVTVVLPTYNERENLAPLLEEIARALAPRRHQILVVDDDSPDRTWEEAERLRTRYPQLRVIRRVGEQGLASAVVRGCREAEGAIVVVMDADLQHDPSILGSLIALLEGADFAVAARASVEGGLRWDRRVQSWVANTLARLVLAVPLSDPMSGYFAMRRELFERLDGGDLRPRGFKILLYLYARAVDRCEGRPVRVREVPFVFRSRLHGESKLTMGVAWAYLRMLGELGRGRWRATARTSPDRRGR